PDWRHRRARSRASRRNRALRAPRHGGRQSRGVYLSGDRGDADLTAPPVPVTAAATVVARWLDGRRPVAAIVLGSGLGRLGDRLEDRRELPYRDIPGFPEAGVEGHAGTLVAGSLNGRALLCQSGRFHAYEGHPAELLALPVRLFAALGIRTLLLTTAAGGIRRGLLPGSLMLLADQVNLTFRNHLIGAVRPGEG